MEAPSGTLPPSARPSASWPRNSSAAPCDASASRAAPAALLHYGQGKWYPGEEPAALGDARFVIPAFEDVAHGLAQEQNWPEKTRWPPISRTPTNASASPEVTPDPGVIEVNIHPAAHLAGELVDNTDGALRGRTQRPARHEKFMIDGRHTGTGGGNHVTLGGRHARRQPAAAPARPAPQPGHLLAEPPVAVLPVLGPVHRPHQPGATGRRGPQRDALRAGDRLPADARTAWCSSRGWSTGCCATSWWTSPATRTAPSSASTSSTRRTGQRPPGPGRIPRLRDAAARAHVAAADAVAARAGGPLLEQALPQALVRWGTELHDRFMLPHFVGGYSRRGDDLNAPATPSTSSGSPPSRNSASRTTADPWLGHPSRTALGHRTLARAGRGVGGLRHRALRRLLGRTPAGQGRAGMTATAGIVTCNGRRCRCAHRHHGEFVAGVRYRAWQPPSALHPTIGVHSPAGVRPGRHLERTLHRRLHLPRVAPRRAQLRHLPGQRQRGRSRRVSRFWEHGHTPACPSAS
jgi:hypothetical protein